LLLTDRSALELESADEARMHNNIGGVLASQGELTAAVTAYGESVEVRARTGARGE